MQCQELTNDGDILRGQLHEMELRQRSFFAQFAAEIRRPHASAPFKDFVKALLIRAQEANLYMPEKP